MVRKNQGKFIPVIGNFFDDAPRIFNIFRELQTDAALKIFKVTFQCLANIGLVFEGQNGQGHDSSS